MNLHGFTAHFLTWIYVSDDLERCTEVLEKFHTDMRRVNVDRIDAWFPTALVGEGQPADFITAFRNNILRRPPGAELHATLCDLFYHLAHHPRMRIALSESSIAPTTPVFWITKALQRHFCLHPGDKTWDPEMSLVTFGGLSYVHVSTGETEIRY